MQTSPGRTTWTAQTCFYHASKTNRETTQIIITITEGDENDNDYLLLLRCKAFLIISLQYEKFRDVEWDTDFDDTFVIMRQTKPWFALFLVRHPLLRSWDPANSIPESNNSFPVRGLNLHRPDWLHSGLYHLNYTGWYLEGHSIGITMLNLNVQLFASLIVLEP